MKTKIISFLYITLLILLMFIPNAVATEATMEGNNWTNIDGITDSSGVQYIRNTSEIIITLQNNDTLDRQFVNDTFVKINTYLGNFPNATAVAVQNFLNATFLPISTYAGNFPNATVQFLQSFVNNTFVRIDTHNGDFPNSSLTSENYAAWNATYNTTYEGYRIPIAQLQQNDTDDRDFVNATFLKINTYLTNFPNDTVMTIQTFLNATFLRTDTYNGNFPNATITSGTLSDWNNTYNTTYEGYRSQIFVLQQNDSQDEAYVNNTFVKIMDFNSTINVSIDRILSNYSNNLGWINNTTMDKNLANFNNTYGWINSTYNLTYQDTYITVQNNLLAWNNTYNATYLRIDTYNGDFPNSTVSSFSASISQLQQNDTFDRQYVNVTFLPISTYNSNFPNTTITAENLAAWNSTYNVSYLTNITSDKNLSNFTNVPGYITSTYNMTYQNNTFTLLTYFDNFMTTFNSTYQNNTQTLQTYFAAFMSTFNQTYQDTYITQQNNLLAWNNTYNTSYQTLMQYGGSFPNTSISALIVNDSYIFTDNTTKTMYWRTTSYPYDNLGLTRTNTIAIGHNAAEYGADSLSDIVAIGTGSAQGLGSAAGGIVAIGDNSALGNNGSTIIAIGGNAARAQSGNNILAIGSSAGANNIYNNLMLIGAGAQATDNNQLIIIQNNVNATTPLIKGDFSTGKVTIPILDTDGYFIRNITIYNSSYLTSTYNLTYQNDSLTLLNRFNDFMTTYNVTYQNNTQTLSTYFEAFMTTYNQTYQDTYEIVQNNLDNWNSTYNTSYNTLLTNSPNQTVTNNLDSWNNTYNTTYEGYRNQISSLQSNDTQLQLNDTNSASYVNNTFVKIITYAGNFPNATTEIIQSFVNATFVKIDTYSGNFPNLTIPSLQYLLNNSGFVSNQSIDRNLANYTNTYSWVNNTTVDKTYSNMIGIPTDYPNASITSENFLNWNATYNASYLTNITSDKNLSNFTNSQNWINNVSMDKAYGNLTNIPIDFYNSTVANNTANWNNTYNASYLRIDTYNENFPNSTVPSLQYLVNNSGFVSNLTIDRDLNNYTNSLNWVNNTTSTKYNATYQNNTFTLLTYFNDFMTTFNQTYQDAYIIIQNNLLAWNSTYNTTYEGYRDQISTLQSNDTTDRQYVNDTFVKIGTNSGDFPNSTVANNTINWNNTYNSTYNVLLTNAPNTTITAENLLAWNSTYNASYLTNVTSDKNLSNFTNTPQFITNTTMFNSTYNLTYQNTYETQQNNLLAWNSTYNESYQGMNITMENNLLAWNSTYNATYDTLITSKEPSITGSTSNVFWNGLKQWVELTYLNITGFNSTVQNIIDTGGYVTNVTSTKFNATYQNNTQTLSTYFASFMSTFNQTYQDTYITQQNNLLAWNSTYNASYVRTDSGYITNISMDRNYSNMTNTPIITTESFTAAGEQNFTVINTLKINSSRVYVNGVKQIITLSYTENIATKSVNFTWIPRNGDIVAVEYTY